MWNINIKVNSAIRNGNNSCLHSIWRDLRSCPIEKILNRRDLINFRSRDNKSKPDYILRLVSLTKLLRSIRNSRINLPTYPWRVSYGWTSDLHYINKYALSIDPINKIHYPNYRHRYMVRNNTVNQNESKISPLCPIQFRSSSRSNLIIVLATS